MALRMDVCVSVKKTTGLMPKAIAVLKHLYLITLREGWMENKRERKGEKREDKEERTVHSERAEQKKP